MEGRVAEAPLSKPRDWGILAAFASCMTILSQSPAVSQPGAISVPLQCQDAFPAQIVTTMLFFFGNQHWKSVWEAFSEGKSTAPFLFLFSS